MADPVPSLDELVEVARKSTRRFGLYLPDQEANAILTAVLPRVVGAAVAVEREECAKVVEERFDVNPGDESEPLGFHAGWEMCARETSAAIRARTVSDQLRALGGG